MARPLDMIGRTNGPTWPDLSNQHTAMTADLMIDHIHNSDHEFNASDFCALSTAFRFSAQLEFSAITQDQEMSSNDATDVVYLAIKVFCFFRSFILSSSDIQLPSNTT